jgi:hypothetical protein
MGGLEGRFRSLTRAQGPDLWPEIQHREPRAMPEPMRHARATIAVSVLAAATLATIALVWAFTRGLDRSHPGPSASSISPTHGTPLAPHVTGTIPVGPRGQVTAVLPAAASIWVAAYGVERDDDNVLVRVDPETMQAGQTVSMPGIPSWEWGGPGMTLGFGSLWVPGIAESKDGHGRAVLTRVDPSSGSVEATVELEGRNGADVAIGEGSVWVAVFDDPNASVVRVDPMTNRVVDTIKLQTNYVRRVLVAGGVVVAEEMAWPDDYGPYAFLEAIEPATDSVVKRAGGTEQFPLVDAVTWDGRLIGSTSDGFVEIDPRTLALGDPMGGSETMFMAAGADGIWFLGRGALELGFFDPATRTIQRFDASIGTPVALAADADRLWVLQFDGKLTRVDLR